jgi:hypothetical protein
LKTLIAFNNNDYNAKSKFLIIEPFSINDIETEFSELITTLRHRQKQEEILKQKRAAANIKAEEARKAKSIESKKRRLEKLKKELECVP